MCGDNRMQEIIIRDRLDDRAEEENEKVNAVGGRESNVKPSRSIHVCGPRGNACMQCTSMCVCFFAAVFLLFIFFSNGDRVRS